MPYRRRRSILIIALVFCLISLIVDNQTRDANSASNLGCRQEEFVSEFLITFDSCFDRTLLLGMRSNRLDELVTEAAAQITHRYSDLSVNMIIWTLRDGLWGGIDENKPIEPGSLMKLPLAMGYLRASETEPQILFQTIALSEEATSSVAKQGRERPARLPTGSVFNVDQLIDRSLILSDNAAAEELNRRNFKGSLFQTVNDLGIGFGFKHNEPPSVTVANFSRIFIYLAASAYLSPKNSNRVLESLASSTYKDGLVRGVPSYIKVAHKFGESVSPTTNRSQLSDCGIVYLSSNPYIACIHVEGMKPELLDRAISDLSAMIFNSLSSH